MHSFHPRLRSENSENLTSAKLATFLKGHAKVLASEAGATWLEGDAPGSSYRGMDFREAKVPTGHRDSREHLASKSSEEAVTVLGSRSFSQWQVCTHLSQGERTRWQLQPCAIFPCCHCRGHRPTIFAVQGTQCRPHRANEDGVVAAAVLDQTRDVMMWDWTLALLIGPLHSGRCSTYYT